MPIWDFIMIKCDIVVIGMIVKFRNNQIGSTKIPAIFRIIIDKL